MSLKKLASQLGLSTSTVSRAINNYPDISQKTKDRVRLAANEMGYQANAAARRLATGQSKNIGLLIPLSHNPHSSQFLDFVLNGATQSLLDHGYLLSAIAIPQDNQELGRLQYLLDACILDAAILIRTRSHDPRIELLLSRNTPFVCYGRSERSYEFAWLDMDNEAATTLSVNKLVELGHRNIAFINASESYYFAKLRKKGFYQAMQNHGLRTPISRYRCAELTEDEGCYAATKILQRDLSISAIICGNDSVAMGALQACRNLGLTPGIDISIIGHNNSPQSRYTTPPLTTIAHNNAIEVGQELGELVFQRIQGEPLHNLQRLMPPIWIERNTCSRVLASAHG